MSVTLTDRPIETVRSEVTDQLIMNYSHGELSYEAFERRLDQAMDLMSHQALVDLTADLPLEVDKAFVEGKKQDLAPNYVSNNGPANNANSTRSKELDYIVNICGGTTRGGAWLVDKEIRCFSLFSGTDVDFTDAQFSQEVVRIRMFSFFSGCVIYVPENVNVISKTFCIFGGVDNRVISQEKTSTTNQHHNQNKPTIIIEGLCVFSGVAIKIKRSMKERMVDLAESLKKMFS